jgi:hypothetical protein
MVCASNRYGLAPGGQNLVMSVEPVGLETAVLEGTDLAISTPFWTFVDRADGLRIKANVHVVDGRLVCRALELSIEEGEIDRKLLHSLGLATMIRRAASHVGWRVGELPRDEGWSEGSRFDAGVIASEVRRQLRSIPLLGPRQLTDAFLEQVAITYRQAINDRSKTTWMPVAALQQSWFGEKTSAEEATARRWIAMARKRGFLEPTVKGRKGRITV